MELKLEVILSSSIKRKKPWPRFCWLGQEKESVYLLDDKRISEINMVSGRTKKKTPKLHHLLNNVVTMTSSQNGMWLCGLLVSGELFLWNRDKDLLKTAAAVPEVNQIIVSAQENSTKLSLQVSCNGMRVLLVAITGQVFLWESTDVRDFTSLRDGPVKGQWAHIQPLEETVLPSSQDKDASQHTIFVTTEVMGDICLSGFVFTSGKQLVITVFKIQWNEGHVRMGSAGYNVEWATKTCLMSQLTPPCNPVKSRGALVPAFSPDGRLLAIVLNQRKPKATQVLFVSTQNMITTSSGLGGCGSKKMDIPSKYIRSYWVGSISWSPGGLFLACMLKRGSLLMLARLGELLTLTSSGCNVDFGPAQFLPLHPLVTYRPPVSAVKGEASLSSSSMSVRDTLRQRYSVTWHPRLLCLIVSDGYMATVMRVLDRPSPALFLKSLLKDVSKDLEKASCKLDKSQVHVKAWLESVSCLNLDSSLDEFNLAVTHGPKTSDSVISAGTDASRLSRFLQEQQTLGGTKELLQSMQAFFEVESDLEGLPAGSHMEEGGRLEFASMFDTLHALETCDDSPFLAGPVYNDFVEPEKKNPLQQELGRIQSRLLTAWAFAMSLGNAVEHRVSLMKQTLRCVLRLAALLHVLPSSVIHTGEKKHPSSVCLLHLIKSLLLFLSWDSTSSDGLNCLGLLVEFSRKIVHLLLTLHPDSYQTGQCLVSSHSLSRIINILQLVTDSLDHAYNLQQRTYLSSEEEVTPFQPHTWPSDVYHVHLLQKEDTETTVSAHQALLVPQRPSSRLLGVWQLVYNITQQYAEELKTLKGCDGWEEEEQMVSVIMSQIQTALQTTGQSLEEGPSLLSYSGERLFLGGSYPKSADAWCLQICEEASKSGERSVFLEKRLCLALLYSLLSQYHLKKAQEFGDHMAQLILLQAGKQIDSQSITDPLPCPWLPMNLHSDAAGAVVQTLGRFMASYFTNQPLFILPAHNVAVLPPLHQPHTPNVGRLVPLSQEDVAKAVRQQHLSEVWTVDYALDLLLLGGLLPEAAWLAYHLGDWKTAVTLSLAYISYCTERYDFTQLRRRELHLPSVLQPESIFQAELWGLLGNKTDSYDCADIDEDKSLTNPLEGEDWDLLWASVQEILKASVMAGVNVSLSPLSSLLEKAKSESSSLPALVPVGHYLPSPPLYCPQPSPNTQDQMGTAGEFAEVSCRHKVSGVLQRLLLLLRSARCCHPAAQWYIGRLRRARHVLHKIKKKYCYPSADQEEKDFPEGLMKLITRGGYFRLGPNKDSRLDSDIIHTIICFRELCALCWMLHVRDQLSLHCRRYQAARQRGREEELSDNSEVNSACVDALRWACRFLPFSHFLGAEEVLQDILLSLLSELPPVPLVADILVRAFPQEEESVRVSLREKYNLLLQRLRQCNVFDSEKKEVNESMMTLIRDKTKHRRKHLGRLRRHLAPPVLHLWGKEEDDEDKRSKYDTAMMGPLSLGTSLSTSTLTDGGLQPLCSDADTAGNSPVAVSPEQRLRATTRNRRAKEEGNDAKKFENDIQEKFDEDGQKGQLPVIGTWEFELEDEEYLNFLELFLSYLLEKNNTDGGDFGSELPLLRSFCSELRERELHSLTFDVLSTLHRRQKGEHHPARKHLSNAPPVFRAGSCYKPLKQGEKPELQTSSVWSEAPISRASLSVSSRTGKQKGLFGRQQRDEPTAGVKEAVPGSETSPVKNTFSTGQPSESITVGSSVSLEAVTDLQQGLDPQLEAQFPELGRLLEWMVRWADRRALLGRRGKKKNVKEREANEGVVIRVKASASAILTSLSLLEYKHGVLPQTERYGSRIQVPEMPKVTVAPVLQPEVDRKLERDSSVDTGYPGSVNTPIAGLHHNLQHGELSHTTEPEEPAFQRTPLPSNQLQLNLDPEQHRSSSQQQSYDDFTEKKDRSGDGESLDTLSSGSNEDTSRNVCTPETSLKLEDLDSSEKAEEKSSSSSYCSPELPEAPAPPAAQPKTIVYEEFTDSSRVHLPNPAVDPPNRQQQRTSVGASAADPTSFNQPSIPPATRQRLVEDLLRLVQHINYMSLSEVLEASFSNLQQAQQSSSVAPPGLSSSQPNVPTSPSTKIIPEPNASPARATAAAAPQTQDRVSKPGSGDSRFNPVTSCELADQPVLQSSAKICSGANQNLLSNTSGAGVSYQELQPLSVQAESPEIQQRKKSLIPSSQGLLATADTCPVIQTPPVLLPSSSSAQDDSSPQVLGLKLLRPQPSVMFQHNETFESYQPKVKHKDQATWKKKRGEQRNVFSAPVKHLTNNPTPRNPQPQTWPSEPSLGQVFPPPRPAVPAFTPASMQGLRLLKLQDVPQSNITFPKLSLPLVSRSAVVSAPVTGAPLVKLLHIDSGPKMMMPRAAPPTPTSRLISMEELTRSEIWWREAEDAQLPLLRAHLSTQDFRRAASPSSCTPSKRQKRREEKAKSRKTEVTFRLNESIILTQEAADVPASNEAVVAEGIVPTRDKTGSSDCRLTGQRLLDRVFSTSAELHAFASTSKRAPESRDAFTNTDSACSLVDKAVSVGASVTIISSESQSPSTSHMFRKDSVQNTETPQKHEEILDQGGRRFISVLDLEEIIQPEAPLHRRSPAVQDIPSSPTSAQLHVLATSVLRAGSDPQPSVAVQPTAKPTYSTDIPVAPPSFSYGGPSRALERIIPQDQVASSDSESCQALKAQSSDKTSSPPPAVQFSSRLSELDAQLAALQNIADNLELDFSNSRMLVNTIEKLSSDTTPDVKTTTSVKKTVRIAVPMNAWTPTSDSDRSTKLKIRETIDEEDEERAHNDSVTPDTMYGFTSPSRAAPSYPHTPPGMKDRFGETYRISHAWEDENLSQTGLSDTVEILDELVREGYLSPTDWSLSASQTAHRSSRQDQQQSSWALQKPTLPEDERKELRIWMRRKQRERLAAYQKHVENLREREHKPFSSRASGQSENKNRATAGRNREGKEKFVLLKQFNQRTREAYSLAVDFLGSPENPQRSSQTGAPPFVSKTRLISAPPPGNARRPPTVSVSEKRRLGSQPGHAPHPQSVEGRQLEEVRRRLGLHRPVTCLPGDRLSRVTRRGMLSNAKSQTKHPAASRSEGQRVGYQRKMGLNSTFSRGAASGRGIPREKTQVEETERVNRSESNRLQGLDEFDLVLGEQDDAVAGGASDKDWMDNLSESAGSSLSKIDWAAIERMVAEEDD